VSIGRGTQGLPRGSFLLVLLVCARQKRLRRADAGVCALARVFGKRALPRKVRRPLHAYARFSEVEAGMRVQIFVSKNHQP
jgi:hypothetical protein